MILRKILENLTYNFLQINMNLKVFFISIFLFSLSIFSNITIEISRGTEEPPRIAIVPFLYDDQSISYLLTNKISDNLSLFGEFEIIANSDLIAFPSSPEDFFYNDWKTLDIDYVVAGFISLEEETSKYIVNYFLFDIRQGRNLLNGTARSSADSLVLSSHKMSNRIYKQITGVDGIFTTKLMYILNPEKDKYQLNICDINGDNEITLFDSPEPIMSPDWSPDGKKISYVSFENGNSEIFIQDLSSGKRNSLRRYPGINSAPVWSPNGNYLAFVSSRSGNPDVYLYDLKTEKISRITVHYGIDTEPSFSANGRKLLFTSNRSGTPQLYEVSLVTRKISRITFDGNYNARGRYFPDGKNIVFVHRSEEKFHISIKRLGKSGLKMLTETALDESPSVSPNNNFIIYATKDAENGYLAGISLDGLAKFKIPSKIGAIREPVWSPFLN
jgi:TolB protein